MLPVLKKVSLLCLCAFPVPRGGLVPWVPSKPQQLDVVTGFPSPCFPVFPSGSCFPGLPRVPPLQHAEGHAPRSKDLRLTHLNVIPLEVSCGEEC